MNNETNHKEALKKDIKYTSGNYANMYSRILFRDNITKFLIVYYSVIAVVNSIIPKYIQVIENQRNFFDFSSIVISIILLVASLSVTLANYPERKLKAIIALDGLKRMKKELDMCSEKQLAKDKCRLLKDFTRQYHEIVDNMELRTEHDYYKTCKKQKSHLERFTSGQIFKVNVICFLENFVYVLLILIPITFYFCVLI